MYSNINLTAFISKMLDTLNLDVIKKIQYYINIDIINKQKLLKFKLNKEIRKYNKDAKYLIYNNNNSIFINNRYNIKTDYKLIKLDNNNSNILLDNSSNISLDNSSNILLDNNNTYDNDIDVPLLNNIANSNIKIIVKYI
jgi:hypothetical protein